MKVLVVGASGCIGSAVAQALRSRGHQVVAASRTQGWRVDFMEPVSPQGWAQRLQEAHVQAVVNCAGILMPRQGQSFERVHAQGPIELFEGAALAGVQRIVQVSALGAASAPSPYLASKRAADQALLALPVQATVLRPSLVFGPGCASMTVFATLASLPIIALPGGGSQALQPIHVYEVAEIVARCLEREQPVLGVFEIGGGSMLSYREMLAAYRQAQGLGDALWLPLPMAPMMLGAWAAEALPQQVLCRETLAMLARGNVPTTNAAPELLGRMPSLLPAGLRVTPPQPLLDLRVRLSPPLAATLRAVVAFIWLWTAAVSAAQPQASGVLTLLAHCGFAGNAGLVMLAASCLLNTGLGLALLLRRGPWVYALQCGAIVAYTAVAALHMPALALDHCGALAKNLPLLALVLLLWLAEPARANPPITAQRPRAAPTPGV